MSILCSVRVVASALLFAMGLCLVTVSTTLAQPASCDSPPPSNFDLREDPFNLSASERDAILDVIYAFALTWDLRDETNLPLLFIDGDANDGFLFRVCTSAAGSTGDTGSQIIAAAMRQELFEYFRDGPFKYVQDNTLQARHFLSNAIVQSHQSNDVKVVATLLVTLQSFVPDAQGVTPLPVVDYTGMIEAVLTKEWGGVWKFRKLQIHMDVPYMAGGDIFRGR
jgi:hypothetical protein